MYDVITVFDGQQIEKYLDCTHENAQMCEIKNCEIYGTSSWVCFARFHPDSYQVRPHDKAYINHYGPLSNDFGNCPRHRGRGGSSAFPQLVFKPDSSSEFEYCGVHALLAEQTSCHCDIWTTGCVCGVFQKEKI